MPYNIKGATYEITTNQYKIFGNAILSEPTIFLGVALYFTT